MTFKMFTPWNKLMSVLAKKNLRKTKKRHIYDIFKKSEISSDIKK